jgi:hypothetical protein
MDMSVNKKGPIGQLGAFEKPRILVMMAQCNHNCQLQALILK